MAFRKANVLFDLEHQLEGVDVEFLDRGWSLEGEARLDKGASLSVDVGDFADWYGVDQIDVTWLDTGNKQVFEVQRQFRNPAMDGEIVTYEV